MRKKNDTVADFAVTKTSLNPTPFFFFQFLMFRYGEVHKISSFYSKLGRFIRFVIRSPTSFQATLTLTRPCRGDRIFAVTVELDSLRNQYLRCFSAVPPAEKWATPQEVAPLEVYCTSETKEALYEVTKADCTVPIKRPHPCKQDPLIWPRLRDLEITIHKQSSHVASFKGYILCPLCFLR